MDVVHPRLPDGARAGKHTPQIKQVKWGDRIIMPFWQLLLSELTRSFWERNIFYKISYTTLDFTLVFKVFKKLGKNGKKTQFQRRTLR